MVVTSSSAEANERVVISAVRVEDDGASEVGLAGALPCWRTWVFSAEIDEQRCKCIDETCTLNRSGKLSDGRDQNSEVKVQSGSGLIDHGEGDGKMTIPTR